MVLELDGNKYEIVITRKNIKNLYLRVKDDMKIYINASYFVNDEQIIKFIENNKKSIAKMLNVASKKHEKKDKLYILEKPYDVVFCNTFKKVYIDGAKIFVKNKKMLDKYVFDYALNIFGKRLEVCYNRFEEKFDFPVLKIKRMKTKWGYCCKRDNFIVLTLNLIACSIDEIDYVIIHELSHFVHFNHSKEFWNTVEKYKPDYKKNQKVLKEE